MELSDKGGVVGRFGIEIVQDRLCDGGEVALLAGEANGREAQASTCVEDGGEIDEWQSTDGGEPGAKTKSLTSGSKYSHNHVKTVLGHGRGDGQFRVLWTYGDATYPPRTRDVYLYHYGERLAKPRRIASGRP